MDRMTAIGRHKRRGGKAVGVMAGRYPRVILEAADLLGVEIWDPPGMKGNPSSHVQPFVCSVALANLALIKNQAHLIRGLLAPHLCDSIQNLFSICRDCLPHESGNLNPEQIVAFYPPRNTRDEHSAAFVAAQLRSIAQQFVPLTESTVNQQSLGDARERLHERDALIRHHYDRRSSDLKPTVGNRAFYSWLRTWEYTMAADFPSFPESSPPSAEPALRVILSGLLPDRHLLELLDRYSIAVVEDDLLSCGRRLLRTVPSSHSDPWLAAAEDFLNLPPCSSIASPVAQRVEFLGDLYTRSQAQAIIFHTVKFCEMELFDHPFLVASLKERDIPVLVLETELHQSQLGQVETRLEAFLEMTT